MVLGQAGYCSAKTCIYAIGDPPKGNDMIRYPIRYPLAERFKAPQGEGLYAGTPFAFMRMVGCSVGQGVCTHCDTDFHKVHADLGGGLYSQEELQVWAAPYRRACITGGEPLDRELSPLISHLISHDINVSIETSGTKHPRWLNTLDLYTPEELWVCVSPKPGYLESMLDQADEIKVIVGGLGDGDGWPTVEDAVRWADEGKLVYIQPRNLRLDIDRKALDEAMSLVHLFPQLRLSTQLHKFLRTR